MKKLFTTLVLTFATFAAPAFAIDLQAAREQGLVGETTTGYVAKISGGDDVAALVSDINLKRREEYERISAENGQPADVVAKLAVNKIVSGLPAGAKYKDGSGKWQTK